MASRAMKLVFMALFCLSFSLSSMHCLFLFKPKTLVQLQRHRHNRRAALGLSYEIKYFTQRLDHFSFSPREPQFFSQRYLVSDKHWSGVERMGPIFVYCGNEGDITWFAENSGFLWDVAPRFGALLVFPEHRYYGESMPYGSKESGYKNAESLAYLTTEQALADFATLIVSLKRNLSAEASPVVLFGGSYGGMLAAWMRLKYPHIAIGALASSAPILQFEDIVPSHIYNTIVSSDFKRESVECYNNIRDSWEILDAIGRQIDGLQYLSEKFHLCREAKNVYELQDWLYSAYSYLAMVDYPYAANFIMPLPAYPIREVCNAIVLRNGDILSKIFAGISVFYNYTGEAECFEMDDDPHGMDGWNWQACTEMVMPMSNNPNTSMFPFGDFDLEEYDESCKEQFGVSPRPTWITTEFGGHGIKDSLENFGSNIVFSNGLLDPWSGGGVLENISDTIVAIVTQEGAHHLDLRFATKSDPDWLVEQRRTEVAHINNWLKQYYENRGVLWFQDKEAIYLAAN